MPRPDATDARRIGPLVEWQETSSGASLFALRRFFFKLHGATRRFRHPLRERRYRLHPETAPAQVGYPRLVPVTDNLPDGHYTDSRGRLLTRDEATVKPHGTRIYRF